MTYPDTPGFVRTSATSKSAATFIEPSAGTVRAWVLKEIRKAGQKGLSCEQVERRCKLRHQSASARIRELVIDGLVEIIGTRENESGVRARVYVAARAK
jgi:hypothetical protein